MEEKVREIISNIYGIIEMEKHTINQILGHTIFDLENMLFLSRFQMGKNLTRAIFL
jgi:hypothetical protein